MKLHWKTLVCGLTCLFLLTVGAGAASIQIYGLDLETEIVTVANIGNTPVDLTGWWIYDKGTIHKFTFPSFTLSGLSSVRIHTRSGDNTATDLYWGQGSDVWNDDGDIATLFDASGVQVSSSDGYQAPIRTVVTTAPVPTPIATTPPGGATVAQAYAYYSAGNTAWSKAWSASDFAMIRQYLNQAKNEFTLCMNMASQVNDPANTANLALMKSVSRAYMDLADAALAMYDGSDVYSTGRTQMNAGNYAGAATSFQSAGDSFQHSQTYFGQATTMLQSVSYAGTSFGDGTAYTAAIVPVLNGKGAYMGEFASYAQGWQHTALAYQASASGDQATFRSEGTQAMNLFGTLRTSSTFGADASSNYNILAGLLGSGPGTITTPVVTPTLASTPVATPLPSVKITGNGDDVVAFVASGTDLRIFSMQYTGASNFIVWLKDEQGNALELLANEIDSYTGKTSEQLSTGVYYLDVSASGPWTIEISPSVTQVQPKAGGSSTTISGSGDDVQKFSASGSGLRVFSMQYTGSSNFIVWLKDGQGNALDLLVNEIGSYTGKKSAQLSPGDYYLDVSASGPWTVEIVS